MGADKRGKRRRWYKIAAVPAGGRGGGAAEGNPMNRPIVGITACRIEVDGRIHHAALERYVGAVSAAAGALPLLVPAVGRTVAGDDLLDAVDGLLFTGSPSNVLPRHYDTPPSRPGTRHDPHRDETTLPLVRGCLERGVPLLAVCRGFQEVNVALGGTLHQHVQELPGMLDHRVDPSLDLAGQYAPVHAVQVVRGGFLHRLVGREAIEVNSLHSQGIDRLAGRLVVEARAPDGLVEAVSIAGAASFALAVQWHPEWNALKDPASRAMFEAFGAAVRERAEWRHGGPAETPRLRSA